MEIYHNLRIQIRTKWCNKFGSMKKDLMAGTD